IVARAHVRISLTATDERLEHAAARLTPSREPSPPAARPAPRHRDVGHRGPETGSPREAEQPETRQGDWVMTGGFSHVAAAVRTPIDSTRVSVHRGRVLTHVRGRPYAGDVPGQR